MAEGSTIGSNPEFAGMKEAFGKIAAAAAKDLSDSDLLLTLSALCATIEIYNAELVRRHQVLAPPAGSS